MGSISESGPRIEASPYLDGTGGPILHASVGRRGGLCAHSADYPPRPEAGEHVSHRGHGGQDWRLRSRYQTLRQQECVSTELLF